ncbi:hypothetical protein ACJIZ3_005078 [Penstemon smallii]|uniref:Uncharacterized protein n=1 Tax=Penstemon smallii TaxID=265156 RepID=A0ABD3S3V7_9LAMI
MSFSMINLPAVLESWQLASIRGYQRPNGTSQTTYHTTNYYLLERPPSCGTCMITIPENYEVSVLDQLLAHHYMPFVYFFPNNHKKKKTKSLSETLTRFYPLAGKVKNSREIDCNDDGVYYVEAKINDRLSDFLKQPNNKSIHQFLPFDCGGIAIGLCTSHKIIDGYSHATFLKAWAAATNESSEEIICPSFISPSIFPPNPAMPESTTLALAPTYSKQSKSATRRFVFSSSSIKELKEKAGASTRVTGLIWKCAVAASKTQSTASNTDPKSSVFAMAINSRNKSSPPMPDYLIGNIFWSSVPILWRSDDDLEMSFIVQRVKRAIAEINNSNFIEKMKGGERSLKVEEHINELKKYYADENAYYVLVTGMCNGGIYDVDLGWGKPIWVSYGNADTDIPLLSNFVVLMDTRVGNGVEAWVTLSEEDMNVLEKDPEILVFASLNPSPLEIN